MPQSLKKFFPFRFSTKSVHAFLFFSKHDTCHTHFNLLPLKVGQFKYVWTHSPVAFVNDERDCHQFCY
jgi:hypothetical protein